MQSLDSFRGLFVIKSKKKQVATKIITLQVRETDLGLVFSGIGSPSTLGVRRDERDSAGTVV